MLYQAQIARENRTYTHHPIYQNATTSARVFAFANYDCALAYCALAYCALA